MGENLSEKPDNPSKLDCSGEKQPKIPRKKRAPRTMESGCPCGISAEAGVLSGSNKGGENQIVGFAAAQEAGAPPAEKMRKTRKQSILEKSSVAQDLNSESCASDLQDCSEASGHFKKYLSRIRAAKLASDKILGIVGAENTPIDTPSATLELLWEMLFDRLCSSQSLEPSEFNTFAGVLQKLSSAGAQIENAKSRRGGRDFSEMGLSPETLEKIESQLNLM